jgi:hypothetical protein
LSLPSNQNITESDLIGGCIAGNRRMQEELYRRFSPRMYAVCLRYAGNSEEAEDILQEGFIKIFKKLGSFRSEGSFEGWIRRILSILQSNIFVANAAFSRLLKKKKIPWKAVTCLFWITWLKGTLWS